MARGVEHHFDNAFDVAVRGGEGPDVDAEAISLLRRLWQGKGIEDDADIYFGALQQGEAPAAGAEAEKSELVEHEPAGPEERAVRPAPVAPAFGVAASSASISAPTRTRPTAPPIMRR